MSAHQVYRLRHRSRLHVSPTPPFPHSLRDCSWRCNAGSVTCENRGASAGQRDPAPKRPADHLRVFAARGLHESLRLAAAHSTPDEERFVAGFRPDMTVVKARQDFLTHEDSAPRERATMELERSPRTRMVQEMQVSFGLPETVDVLNGGFDCAAIDHIRITAASGIASDLSLSPVEELADISNAP